MCHLTSLSFALMKLSSRFGCGMNVVARGSDDVLSSSTYSSVGMS